MALTAAELRAVYTVDEGPLTRSLAGLPGKVGKVGDATEKTTGRMSGSMRSAAGAIAGFFAFDAVKSGLMDTLGAASDLNETVSKSNTIFGANAASINKWAGGAAKNLGLSKQQALAAAAGFGDMFSQIGFAGDQAADMSTKVVQMSADLGSFNNLPTAEVADRISAAFRGEYDSLQALIPNINAARVEQEAMAATGKKNAAELTAQEKAAAVLAIVNKDGARAMGDFARTSDGNANSQKILAATWEDSKAKLGELLTGPAASFTQWLTDAIPKLEAFGGWIKDNSSWLLPLGGAIVTVVAAVKAWSIAQGILNFVLAANPIGIIVLAIAGLVTAFVLAYQKSETFRDIVNGAFDVVKRGVGNAIGFMITGFRGLLTVWLTIADGIVSGAATALGWVPGLGDKLKAANTAFDNMKNGILTTLDDAAQAAYGFGEESGSNAAKGLAAKRVEAFNAGQQVADDMGRGVGSGSGTAYTAGANAAQGLIDGMKSKQFAVAKQAQILAITAGKAMQSGLQERSPSRWTMWMGEMLGEGLVIGIQRSEADVVRAMTGLTNRMTMVDPPTVIGVRAPALAGGAPAAGAGAGAGYDGASTQGGGYDALVKADTINIIEGTPDDLARRLSVEARTRGTGR